MVVSYNLCPSRTSKVLLLVLCVSMLHSSCLVMDLSKVGIVSPKTHAESMLDYLGGEIYNNSVHIDQSIVDYGCPVHSMSRTSRKLKQGYL